MLLLLSKLTGRKSSGNPKSGDEVGSRAESQSVSDFLGSQIRLKQVGLRLGHLDRFDVLSNRTISLFAEQL